MAKVIDIRNVKKEDIPQDEVFAVDTNALIWTHYSKASSPHINKHPYQVIEYPNFISKLMSNGNKIVTTTLNITELCNVTEHNEYRIYKAINKISSLSFKDFRKIQTERMHYKNEIDTMIMEIKAAYDNQIEIINVSDEIIENYKKELCQNNCDVFDFIAIEHLKKLGIHNYITDDKDFTTVSDINLYTTSEVVS
jgi:predicted nucleic acid-binding protein